MVKPNRFHTILETCTWQNRLYALTVFAVFILVNMELKQILKRTPQVKINANVINSHNYPYLINQLDLCDSPRVFLAIFVTSLAADFSKRRAIRETWGTPSQLKKMDVVLAFLVGNPKQLEQQGALQKESRVYGDILQEDFVDAYSNLTLKSIMALKWSSIYCRQAQFLMKTDSDIFVNVRHLVEFLRTKRKKRLIVGCVKDHVKRPLRFENGRMQTVLSLPKLQPDFVAGAGYVISGDLVKPLYERSLITRYYPVEDVFVTGKCASSIGVHPEHDDRFSCGEIVSENCLMSSRFTGHKVTPERQYWIWEDLQHTCNGKIVPGRTKS